MNCTIAWETSAERTDLQKGMSQVRQALSAQRLSILYPPTTVCLEPGWAKRLRADRTALRGRGLAEGLRLPITVFSHEFGALPSFSTSTYCRSMFGLVIFLKI